MGRKTEKIFERARENLERQNHEHALRLFNQVLNREPAHVGALRNKALIKIMDEEFDEAVEFLLFAIEQNPKDDQLYQLLGTAYHNNGEPKKALTQFQKAIKLNNSNTLAQQGIAMIHAHILGEHDQAIVHFTKALEQQPDNADLLFNRGCSLMINNEMKKAEKDLRKAAEYDHDKARELVENYFS